MRAKRAIAGLISFSLACSPIVSVSAQESETNGMTPGTYTGKATGMDGEVTIDVTVDESSIVSIDVVDDNETAGVGDKALEIISKAMVENQSLAIDSVSGATISSAAIKTAVSDAMEQAGADVDEWKSREVAKEVKDETFDYDVVVVGAGFAGLQAASNAARAGAKVALVEKLGLVGGTSIFSSGAFVAAFTEEEVPEKMQIWVDRNTQEVNQIDMDKLSVAMGNSPEILSTFTEMGVEGKPFMETGWGVEASEKAVKNVENIKLADAEVHAKGGEYLVSTIMNYLETTGVDVFVNMPATSLLTSDEGAVTGVVCESETGVKTFNAKSVVLCTGTYSRNAEMCEELDPSAVKNFSSASKGDTGEGMQMAIDLGADVYDYQHKMSGIFAPDPYDMPVVGQPWNSYPYDCVLVNSKAEDKGTHFQMEYFIEEDGPDYGWVVMDQEVADRFLNLDKYLEATESGSPTIAAYKADSLEALAADMGVDAAKLQETVERYNKLCEAGEDTDCGKDAQYLNPIDDGTYYAVKEYDMIRGEFGGIVTNDKAEVLTKDKTPISGLYAAGLISSGDLVGDFYPGMEALGICAYMGYIAGQESAAHATN